MAALVGTRRVNPTVVWELAGTVDLRDRGGHPQAGAAKLVLMVTVDHP